MSSLFHIIIDRVRQAPYSFDVDVDPRELDLSDPQFKFPGRVTGRLEFKVVGNDLRGVGTLSVEVEGQCGRCLAPVRERLEAHVDTMWLHKDPTPAHYAEPAHDEILAEYFTGDVVDTAPTLRELIMAELPLDPLCSEECKGLCPGCGADLNTEACRCGKDAEERRGELIPEWKRKLKELGKNE